jgi:hypothetical protein
MILVSMFLCVPFQIKDEIRRHGKQNQFDHSRELRMAQLIEKLMVINSIYFMMFTTIWHRMSVRLIK